MISEELQNSWESFGFPVNLPARKTKANYTMTKVDRIGEKIVSQKLTQEEVEQIDRLIGRISELRYYDQQIWTIIYTEATKFFAGEETVEDAGRIIQNKVETYLNE